MFHCFKISNYYLFVKKYSVMQLTFIMLHHLKVSDFWTIPYGGGCVLWCTLSILSYITSCCDLVKCFKLSKIWPYRCFLQEKPNYCTGFGDSVLGILSFKSVLLQYPTMSLKDTLCCWRCHLRAEM